MGGRGGASGIGRKSQSALDPKAKEQTITTFYRRKSIYGPHYRDDVYEAVEQKNEKGGIDVQLRSGILIHLALPTTFFVGLFATDSKPEAFTVSDEESPYLLRYGRFSYL